MPPLGQLVLERGIVFIDLAIAQVAGLGAGVHWQQSKATRFSLLQ
jgi:hypothetical protein